MPQPELAGGRIAVEEHFVVRGHERYISSAWMSAQARREVIAKLSDVGEARLAEMDAAGIGVAVLSLASEGIQSERDRGQAVRQAAAANDALAEIVAAHPSRYVGLAAVALQDPDAACRELTRAVLQLGFRGVCVNGYTDEDSGGGLAGGPAGGLYCDDPRLHDFWETLEGLGVPLYLHPRYPLPSQRGIYEGRHELLGSTWGFGVETATHALRMIASGLFDRFPSAQVVLGHLGELLPFALPRMQARMRVLRGSELSLPVTGYLRRNFHLSTSGNFHTQSLIGCLLEVGAERLMFAVDHPFERMHDAARWFDSLPIAEADRTKIARTNAERLFGLGG